MSRHLLFSVLSLSMFACSGDSARGQSETTSEREAAADTLVDVGGYRLHLRVSRGTQPTTVIFEAGGGADLDSWGLVPDQVAARTAASIVTYDRAGLGTSELGPLTLTPLEEVQGLWRAVDGLGLPRKTVIVAHSYGALLALIHAHQFGDMVEALVLVDPMNPRFMNELGEWLKTTVPTITDPATNREHVIQRMSRTFDALTVELFEVEPQLDLPMWILSAGQPWWGFPAADEAWSRTHVEMAAVSANRRVVTVAGADHDVPGTHPGPVVEAILEALTAISTTND
jgi:pimeloyl-ACP methyl ester carboxylesterase